MPIRHALAACSLILALTGQAIPALAQDAPARVGAALDQWLAGLNTPPAAVVVMSGGREVAAIERGLSVDAPVDLQSTSKAITGMCVKALVDEGWLTYDTTIDRYIPGAMPLTVAELLTHTSGLKPDETQGAMAAWRGDPTPRWYEVSSRALNRAQQTGTRGSYFYNNENYALLGVVIEQATGLPYDVACADRVLGQAGLTTARLSPRTGAYGPWGGWQMSARDYARFHDAYFVGFDPASGPQAQLGGGAVYGLGMLGRRNADGSANHWHFGSLCFSDGVDEGGSFTVSWGWRYNVFAVYRACIPGDAMNALDRTLAGALLSQ
ncbi:serine hydrolase domain-containing protein [Pseudoponticoccus marisrubri]|uniref:Beta-lactamase-related domain-containing protein n=1 Tax=Pseudoponticoccus marisrubri TaxID=1685382 RepID=A0A0W7WN46_9RHOB|nr:serine hydrolase domain-containing protein [Pseudoponticoccus marisrubri]KUF12018.1 hypothetical protein AVJ23_05440 [Pseudoponticoccus marisrubri]